jgi:hypothetical protein
MYIDSVDPYDGGGSWGGGSSGGSGSGTTGGTDPTNPPRWTPGGNGWWEFVAGAWRWMTEPAPALIRTPI